MVNSQCCNCFSLERLINNRAYEIITRKSIDVYNVVKDERLESKLSKKYGGYLLEAAADCRSFAKCTEKGINIDT